MANQHTAYVDALRKNFHNYRGKRFAGREALFEDRPGIGPVVFKKLYADHNILIPPSAGPQQRGEIIKLLPEARRHRHFASMQSSQALAQSIFGTIKVLGQLAMLSSIVADNDQPAFAPKGFLHRTIVRCGNDVTLELEKKINTLGERPLRETSADVWWSTTPSCIPLRFYRKILKRRPYAYRVAVECKFAEEDFGKCSRPKLKPDHPEYCDGDYARQKDREHFCALTEIGVQYWDHLSELCGLKWAPNVEHRPCPLEPTYQVIRNILAACVGDDRKLDTAIGHALVIYDERNPAMLEGGECHDQWLKVSSTLKVRNCLRRMSWQSFIGQWPSNEILDWLKQEVAEKYGLPSA